jgi:hypothetical protein
VRCLEQAKDDALYKMKRAFEKLEMSTEHAKVRMRFSSCFCPFVPENLFDENLARLRSGLDGDYESFLKVFPGKDLKGHVSQATGLDWSAYEAACIVVTRRAAACEKGDKGGSESGSDAWLNPLSEKLREWLPR